MYYIYNCSYCSRIFYTYNASKENASKILYKGIKRHLIDYDEDEREFEFDDGPTIDSNEVYVGMRESEYPPPGGYELE